MEQPNVSWNEFTTKWLVVLMSKIIMPDGFSEHAPNKQVKNYINMRRRIVERISNHSFFNTPENDQLSFQKLDPQERNDLKVLFA